MDAKTPVSAEAPNLEDILEFIRFTNLFRSVERLIWFRGVESRERDGEHSFQLALVGWFINERFKLGLDVKRIIIYALVHDLPEAYAGDACWSPTGGYPTQPVEGKEGRERAARKQIAREWGHRFPSLVKGMEDYFLQHDEESRVVYALDKLITELNIFDDETGRTNKKLGVTRKHSVEYKTPRTAKHPMIAELYRQLLPLMDRRPGYFYEDSSS